jgi:hypothetical protein
VFTLQLGYDATHLGALLSDSGEITGAFAVDGIFTNPGGCKLYSGADLTVYSDAGSTEQFSVDGATGNVVTKGNVTLDLDNTLIMGSQNILSRSAGITRLTARTGTTPEAIYMSVMGTATLADVWSFGVDTLLWTPMNAAGNTAVDTAYLKITGVTALPVLNMYATNDNSTLTLQLGFDATHKGALLADDVEITDTLVVGGNIGFYGAAAGAKPEITGSKGSNAALTDLIASLAVLGLITDSTT